MSVAIPGKGANLVAGVVVFAVAVYALFRLKVALQTPLIFDDSYMFYRYAMNMRHGLGMSWNQDGVHTYGETAPLWGIFVLVLTYLPMTAAHALIVGSWVCGIGAVVAMAWAVARNAESILLRSTWRVLPMIALPLCVSPIFMANAVTGMETMLAAMLVAIYLGLAISWRSGRVTAYWLVLVGLALFLTRPESALVVLMVPVLLVFAGRGHRSGVAIFSGVFLSGILLDVIFCKLYFHTPLPLSFYMKNGQAYEGYHRAWHPLGRALVMLANCGLFLAVLVLFTRKSEWKFVAALMLPMLATFAYLCTVTQIMGWNSRYYVPYFAFFVVPALLILDQRIKSIAHNSMKLSSNKRLIWAAGVAACALVFVLSLGTAKAASLVEAADRRLERRAYVYDPVQLLIEADRPLPRKTWFENIHGLGDLLLGPLPRGTTIAASEVGYLGAANLQANVIDIEGLNDNAIALHGFRTDALVKRAPDIIWMPHPDYTYQRGLMLTNPALLEQYDVYAGVADYGIALRKDSPHRLQIDRQMKIFWEEFYPGYKMEDYLVRSTSWSGKKYMPTAEQDRQAKRNGSNGSAQFQ